MGASGMISSQITRTVSDGISKNLFDNLIIPQLKVKNSSGKIFSMQLNSSQRYLSLLLEDGTARVWDLDIGIQRPMIKLQNTSITSIYPSSQQNILYLANGVSIDLYDLHTAKPIGTLPVQKEQIKEIIASPDDSTLVISSALNELSAWETKSKNQRWSQTIAGGNPLQMSIDQQNQFLALLIRKPSIFSSSDQLEIRNLSNGSVIKTLDNEGEAVIFFEFTQPDIIESTYANGDIINWNVVTGKKLSSKNIGHDILSSSKTANHTAAYAIDKNTVLIVTPDGKVQSQIASKDIGIQSIKLLANGNKLLTANIDGTAVLWDTKTAKKVLQIISTKQGWSVVDSFGRFDSSEQGMSNISWEAGDKEIPLDSFSKKYYEPGLLATAIKEETYLNQDPAAIQKGISLPPLLEIIIKDIKSKGTYTEFTVEVYGQGGGINNVNLYHNTKAIAGKNSILNEKSFTKAHREHRSMQMKVTPINGVNSIKVIASNEMGIEGQSKEVTFKISKADKKPTLKIITIGINQYKDAQLNLDYSVKDAQSILKRLNNNDFSKFSSIEKRQLYNSSATKLAIMSELINLSNGAANDVLAIYFAGHGLSIDGEWYFLPYETTLQPDMNYFKSVGISASELSSIFVDSNIQQILLMVDACYSGASIDSFRQLQNSQRHFSRDMSKSVGITVITATRKDQKAAELSELGHGLFTYVLSKGMSGEADWWPKNNEISAHELVKFSTDTIPVFSKRFLGSAQEPTAFTMGKDFPLLTIKK